MAIDLGVKQSVIWRIIIGHSLAIISLILLLLSVEWVKNSMLPSYTGNIIVLSWALCLLIVSYTCGRRRHNVLWAIAKLSKKTDTYLEVQTIANKAVRSRVTITIEMTASKSLWR
jgi:hypothetical protein